MGPWFVSRPAAICYKPWQASVKATSWPLRPNGPRAPGVDNRTVSHDVHEALQGKSWTSHGATNVIVTKGVVELWGWVETKAERQAMLLAAQEFSGVQRVVDHLGAVPPAT